MEAICERIEAGHGTGGDIDKLDQVALSIGGQTICALGDAAAWPTRGFAKKFREEFLQHITERRCPLGGGSLH